jgi:hypothetical protein
MENEATRMAVNARKGDGLAALASHEEVGMEFLLKRRGDGTVDAYWNSAVDDEPSA